MLRKYETLLITKPGLERSRIERVLQRFEDTVEKTGGKVTKKDEWGARRLAYPIKKHEEAYYVLVEFDGETGTVKTLSEHLNLEPEVLRHITTRRPG